MFKPVPYRVHMPRDRLTREQIIRAAVDLLDVDGLQAQLTARRTPAGQNAPKPPRHSQEPLGGRGLAAS